MSNKQVAAYRFGQHVITVILWLLFLWLAYELHAEVSMEIVWIYLAVVNVIGFSFMLMDKQRSKAGARRIPEAVLFRMTAIGGGVGTITAMFAVRHKTKKWYFRLFFPLITVVNGVCIYIVYFR